MNYHNCPHCERTEEAIPERCPDYLPDWEYAEEEVDPEARTREAPTVSPEWMTPAA
jgi:hypothetical protein